MALVTQVRVQRDIPHEAGEWMVFKKLSHNQLQAALRERRFVGYADLRELGPELMDAVMAGNRDQLLEAAEEHGVGVEEIEAAQGTPMARYDHMTVLRFGLVDWSYSETLNDANRGELDSETALWAVEQTLQLSVPDEFSDTGDDDDMGNGQPDTAEND